MLKYESIKIGDKAEITHTITESDVSKFVDLTGDDNKLHIDKEYASKTSFKKTSCSWNAWGIFYFYNNWNKVTW